MRDLRKGTEVKRNFGTQSGNEPTQREYLCQVGTRLATRNKWNKTQSWALLKGETQINQHLFIQWVCKHLMSSNYIPEFILGPRSISVNNIDRKILDIIGCENAS